LRKVSRGMTTAEEVFRVTQEDSDTADSKGSQQ